MGLSRLMRGIAAVGTAGWSERWSFCAVVEEWSTGGDGIFVEAIAAVRGGADAGRCKRQGDRCCKDKNQTILGDSPGRQGGRPLSGDGYGRCFFFIYSDPRSSPFPLNSMTPLLNTTRSSFPRSTPKSRRFPVAAQTSSSKCLIIKANFPSKHG